MSKTIKKCFDEKLIYIMLIIEFVNVKEIKNIF